MYSSRGAARSALAQIETCTDGAQVLELGLVLMCEPEPRDINLAWGG